MRASQPGERDIPIMPWRIVAGAFVHFVVPAYVIALVIVFCVSEPVADFAAALHRTLPVTGYFLAAYVATATACTLAAAVLDRPLRAARARRRARDPLAAARESERRLADALAQGHEALGGDVLGGGTGAMLASLRRRPWHHADPRHQALARDLAELIRASAAALETAPAERRGAIIDLAAKSLAHIDAQLAMLEQQSSALDEGDLGTVARYVELRYGSDSTSGLT